MPVNRPHPVSITSAPAATAGDSRLYLRDQDLNEGAALIRAASRRLSALAEAVGSVAGISPPEIDILQELHDMGPMDVGQLRLRLGAPKQSLARNLNQLEARDMLKRDINPRDRRSRLVTLTPAGAALAHEATEQRRHILRQAFLSAGPDAVSGARRVLNDVLRERGES